MKAAVLLLVLLTYFQVEIKCGNAKAIEDETELDSEELACIDELHLDKEEIAKLNKADVVPEDNPNFNSFLGCYYQKKGWQDSEGIINYDNLHIGLEAFIKEMLRTESFSIRKMVLGMLRSSVKYCQENPLKGDTHGQTAVKAQNCIVNKLNSMIYGV